MKRRRSYTEENFEHTALLGTISSCDEIPWGPPAEDVARRIHPTSCFCFVAEYFQRPAPNGIGARMLKLPCEFSGRSRIVRVSHAFNLSPVPLTISLSTPKLLRNAGGE